METDVFRVYLFIYDDEVTAKVIDKARVDRGEFGKVNEFIGKGKTIKEAVVELAKNLPDNFEGLYQRYSK